MVGKVAEYYRRGFADGRRITGTPGEALAAANERNAGLRKDAAAGRALAERTFEKASKALAAHQALVKPRPSPAQLLRPVDETALTCRRGECGIRRNGLVATTA